MDGAGLFESRTVIRTGDLVVDREVWLLAHEDIADAVFEAIDPTLARKIKEVEA